MRRAITPHERLSVTFRFLDTGRSYEDLKFSAEITPQTLGVIIPETCWLNFLTMTYKYLKQHITTSDAKQKKTETQFLFISFQFPKTECEWIHVGNGFERKWDFPNCLGAGDGKHVKITPPTGSGSFYWNYKGFNSLVLMSVANANYEFLYCDVGTNGRVSDGGVIENTKFYEKLLHK